MAPPKSNGASSPNPNRVDALRSERYAKYVAMLLERTHDVYRSQLGDRVLTPQEAYDLESLTELGQQLVGAWASEGQ